MRIDVELWTLVDDYGKIFKLLERKPSKKNSFWLIFDTTTSESNQVLCDLITEPVRF